jgi:thioesterase domain-containing protein
MPDLFGLPLSYMSLARHLAPDQPVYGLSPGPLGPEMIERPSMKALVSAFVDEIRKLQPEGPYHISGYSFGGAFAFAVACALEADGHAVNLILIDSSVHRGLPSLSFMLTWARTEWFRSVADMGVRKTARRIVRYRHTWMRWFTNRKTIAKREVPYWVPARYKTIARALMQARLGYEIRPFGGHTLFLVSLEQAPTDSFMNSDGLLGWRRFLSGPVVRHPVEETHYRMMQEPFAGEIARILRNFIHAGPSVNAGEALEQTPDPTIAM